jgi:peptide/nickel transport system substrate-binding protein
MNTNPEPVPRRAGRWRAAAAVALGAVIALGAAGCASSAPASAPASAASGDPVDGGTLYWGIETKLQTVNPHRNGQDKASPILRNAFDSYLYRTESGDYQPWLAKAYKIDSGGKKVTLTLADGVTFSDGAPLNADAVVANFDKIRSKGYLTSIPGGLRFLTSYAKQGDDTVVFTLSQPDSLFLQYLSSQTSSPLSPATLAKPQTVLESGGPELAGIGPFTIESFTPNTELTFAKRADYHWAPEAVAAGQGAAHLDKVVYRTLAEGSTRTGALQQGQVQVASDIQPLDVSVFNGSSDFSYVRTPVGGLPYSYYFNVSKAPFDDVRVREAFVKGVDLSTIVTSIYSGAFDQAAAPISAKGPFADPSVLAGYATDIDAANKLLDDAGWTQRNSDGIRTKDGQTLTVRAVSAAPFVRESRDQLAIAIGAALKQNVGIDYQFKVVDLGSSEQAAKDNQYEIFDNSYGGADPASGLDLLYSSDPTRGFIAYGKYNDKTVDELLDKGRFSTDLSVRKTAYTALQKYVAGKYYVLPLYQTQDNLAATAKVHGVTIDAATGQPFGAYKIWLQP